MKPAEGVHVEWVEDEAVVFDPRSGHLHYLNPPAALVYALIQELGYEGTLASVSERFPDVPEAARDVPGLIQEMVEAGLLEGD